MHFCTSKNRDDPRSTRKCHSIKKDLFWLFKTGDTWWRIPKPPVLGLLFGAMTERFMDYTIGENPHAFDELAEQFASELLPNLVPTAFLPWIEIYFNKDTFRNIPIVPEGELYKEPSEQYSPYTSSLAKTLGKMFGISPRAADHIIKGYGGGLGRGMAGACWAQRNLKLQESSRWVN